MRSWIPHISLVLLASFLPEVFSQATTSFIINSPNANSVWLDGSTNSIEWTIGGESIKIFDIEMARLSSSGIKYVAENVSVTLGALNVNIQNLPAANDYQVIFIDAGAGIVHAISNKFTITASRDAANGKTVSNKPTASIVGPPNPLETWALQFDSNGNAKGAAAGRPVPALQWWIGALGLLGAGAVSLL